MDESTLPAQPSTDTNSPQFRLRLWPGLVLVAVLWLARVVASMGEFSPGKFFFCMIIAPFAVLAGLQLWTLFASRMRWSDGILVFGTFRHGVSRVRHLLREDW